MRFVAPGQRRRLIPLARSVSLHVGVAKTGTSYLQRILFSNKERLRAAGHLYPGDSPHTHFRAALDLRGGSFKGHSYDKARGTWPRLADEVRAFDGSAIISHEMFARTGTNGRTRVVSDLAVDDLQVVITARDLGRQIPAVWQENVKNRSENTYAEYLHAIFEQPSEYDAEVADELANRFWRAHDLAGVAARWAKQVTPENVTIVTVPHDADDPDELWNRFREACRLPELDYEIPPGRENKSLGSAESEVLRRMNAKFPERMSWPQYEALVKGKFAVKVLAAHRAHGPLDVPAAWREQTVATAERQIERLSQQGYRVVGNLDELRPRFTGAANRSPDDLSQDELLDLTVELLARVAEKTRGRQAVPERGKTSAWRRVVRRLRRD